MKPESPKSTATAKTRYLSGISHELRTPLNVIMGYAQLLENQAQDDDPNKEKYSLMRHNCEHLNHLIEGILEFSAIEAGKLKVQPEPIDLNAMLKQLTVMFEHQAQNKNINFNTLIVDTLPQQVKTDPKRLQQILINLLNNAIKFTEHGAIDFKVSYRNQVATFIIKDTGRGIHADDMDRIFTPFERIEHADNPVKGTGLGLPITRLLVDLLGGELTVNSEQNHGSEFKVKLMLAPVINYSTHQTHQKEYILNNTQKTHKNFKLLVVDDEAAHRDLLVEMLAVPHFNLNATTNGTGAQKLAHSHDFDLAIIDVSMPGMNGFELAAWFKQRCPETKIIMLSANPRDLETSAVKNHDAYLTKPIIIETLFTEINQQLNIESHSLTDDAINNENHPIIELTAEHHQALTNMLEIGHIKGIQNYLQRLHDAKTITSQQFKILIKPISQMNLAAFKQIIDHKLNHGLKHGNDS